RAFEEIRRQKPDALFVARGATTYAFRHQIGEFASSMRLASACPGITEFTEAGCLMAYGGNTFEVFRRAASHVSRILNGAKPGDLPIERPNIFELTINLRTARVLGIAVPPALRARADRVIE
ncbi:MAG TPA: ABC transporter substrate binding protein, partial [Burkholderiales bacterium]|nr:ABC transporter substrate binding protein [Burkholderiales bacterium]